jgi:hypothetical protein
MKFLQENAKNELGFMRGSLKTTKIIQRKFRFMSGFLVAV